MTKKRILIILLIGVFLLGIVGVIVFLQSLSPSAPQTPTPNTTPTSVPQQNNRVVQYDSTGTDELLRIVTVRPTLPPTDSEVRTRIIESIGNNSGVLYESEDVRIEYVAAPNYFDAEIKTININQAKNIAIQWFTQQGMTREGICALPFSFYLSSEIRQSLTGTNYVFNPLPDFCL